MFVGVGGGTMKDMVNGDGHDSVILSNLEDEMKDLLASFDHDDEDDDVFEKRLDSIGSQHIAKNKCNGNHQYNLEEDKIFEKFIFENEEKIGENDFLNLFGELKLAEPKMEAKSVESESYNSFGADYLNKNNNCAPKENMSTSSLRHPDRKTSSTSIVLKRNTAPSNDMVMSSRRGGENKFNPSLAMQQIRQKHHGILAARLEKIQNRSAPTSPTTRKKYSTLQEAFSALIKKSKVKKSTLEPVVETPSYTVPASSRLHSSSQARGRSTQRSISVSSDGRHSPARSEIAADQYAHHMRSLSCSNSAIVPSHGGINKASSMRSLQLGRPRRMGGSNLSLISLDSEAHEEELMDYYQEAKQKRKKDEKVAELDKARLHNIVNMCAELLVKRTAEEGSTSNHVASTTSELRPAMTSPLLSSSATGVGASSNYRRLASFEDDIMRESNEAKQQQKNMVEQQQQYSNSTSTAATSHLIAVDDVTHGASGDVTTATEPTTMKKTSTTMLTKKLRTPRRMADVEEIRRLRDESLSKADEIQQRIGHLEEQISECSTGAEMEKALMLGELSCERKLLVAEERKCDEIKDQIIQLEEKYMEEREIQQKIVSKEKERLIEIENSVSTIKNQIDKCPESLRGSMEEKLNEKEEALEEENRNFEDAEFTSFEILSKLDEDKEEKQRKLISEKKIIENNISNRKTRIELLEHQISELGEQHKNENQRLNMTRDDMIGNLQEQRKETLLLEDKHYQMTGEYPQQQLPSPSLSSPYQQAAMTSSFNPTTSSNKSSTSVSSPSKLRLCGDLEPHHANNLAADEGLSLGSPTASVTTARSNDNNTSPNLNQLEMSKQQQQPATASSSDIRHMRMKQTNQQQMTSSNRVLHLPPTSALHRPNHYQPLHHHHHYNPTEQRWNDCISIGSMDSLDTSLSNWSVSNVDSLDRVRQMERLIEDATAEKQRLLAEVQQQQRDASTPSTSSLAHLPPTNEEKRVTMTSPSPDTSSNSVRMRHASGNSNERRQIRPMTRYLPVLTQNFDLRRHIEGCGHSPSSSPHTSLTHDSCRGYLTKMGGRVKTWKRRWFVFDRHAKLIKYFKNKHEIKKRGEIPFLNIENVFFDHLKTHKSPDPSLTFCIKCLNRIYFMVAPSSESMRIWMDVIMTGAMGHAYQKTYE